MPAGGAPGPGPNIGLVHDYLLVMRGAERTFAAMGDCWPQAPLYTLLFDRRGTSPYFDHRDVTASLLNHLPVRQNGFRRLLPLFPAAVERLPIQGHDVVLSSSSAFAHGVRPAPGATHICYCHSPFRYVHFERDSTLTNIAAPFRPVMRRILEWNRGWDIAASRRVDHYIANSELTRQRIQECYGRDATVIHPPVDVDRFTPGTPENFFLIVTEIVRHKRVGLALEAARRAKKHVVVVGSGPELNRLKAQYGRTAQFLGRVGDSELNSLYAGARALIVPNVEEFGIGIVEAQAAGRPVIAADGGGAREIIRSGETGQLVPVDDVDALTEALREIDFNGFQPQRLVANAARFSPDSFRSNLMAEVERLTGVGAIA